MELVEKGVRRVRKSLLFNAIAGALFWMISVFGGLMVNSEENVMFFLIVVGTLYLAWVVTLITAIVFQYGGAIALVRAKKREKPPYGKMLFVAGIFIIVDPLFNLLSLVGMIMIPVPFARDKQLYLLIGAVFLFIASGLGAGVALINYIPTVSGILVIRIAALAVGAFFKILNICAYMMLYRVYLTMKLPTKPAD